MPSKAAHITTAMHMYRCTTHPLCHQHAHAHSHPHPHPHAPTHWSPTPTRTHPPTHTHTHAHTHPSINTHAHLHAHTHTWRGAHSKEGFKQACLPCSLYKFCATKLQQLTFLFNQAWNVLCVCDYCMCYMLYGNM